MVSNRRRVARPAIRRSLLAAVVALACALPSRALAQTEPSEIDKDAARTSMQQGDERLAAKDYEGALESYKRADAIMGVPTTAIEVGKLQLKLNKLVQAHESFKRAAAYPRQDGEPPPFTIARLEAKKLAREVAPRIATLSIIVRGNVPREDLNVMVDDEPVEAWATDIPMNPGLRVITVVAPGYTGQRREVVFTEGEKRSLSFALALEQEDDAPPVEQAPEAPSSMWPMAYAGIAVAGVGLVVGAITGGISLTDANKAKTHCDEATGACDELAREPLDRSRTLAHVSTASFVVAGVGAAVGIVGLVMALSEESDDEQQSDDAFRLEGSWLPGGGFATLQVRF